MDTYMKHKHGNTLPLLEISLVCKEQEKKGASVAPHPSLIFRPHTWCAAEHDGLFCFWWNWKRRSLYC